MSRIAYPADHDFAWLIREATRLFLVLAPFGLCLFLYIFQD
jgi:hypothetical protein